MPDSIDVTGSGNFIANNVSNSTINASIVIGKSGEYRELEDKLNTLQKLFDRTPETEVQERLEISEKIGRQKAFIESFKRDVIKLAETFERTELNTERLQKAKEHFDKGEITEARVLLEDAEEERSSFVTRALGKQREYEEKILPGLQNAATEYLILAQATALNFENPNRFQDTNQYYKQAIAAHPSFDNLFAYAYFLHEHLQYKDAVIVYERIRNEFAAELDQETYAMLQNNLAVLHSDRNEFEEAEGEFGEALEMYRMLVEKNPEAYLPKVATTLNNLANLHSDRREFESAEGEYGEALKIVRKLADKYPEAYLPDVAMTLNNLAELHRMRNEFEAAEGEYGEALEIRRELAKKSPEAYLPDVAVTLNNLAILHRARNEFEAAEGEYGEALEIRRKLAEKNPQAYLPNLGNTLRSFALFYQDSRPYKEKSVALALEAVAVLVPLAEKIPAAEEYFGGAIAVLKDWGMSVEEIMAAISEDAGG